MEIELNSSSNALKPSDDEIAVRNIDKQSLLKPKEPSTVECLMESCCCFFVNQTEVSEGFIYPPVCSFSCYLCKELMNPCCLYCPCCEHKFRSDEPITIVWFGDVHVLGGIRYSEWKDISASLRYNCPLTSNFNKEKIQTSCYVGIYSCCANFVITCGVIPLLATPCNFWNGSLLLTSLQSKGYQYKDICSFCGWICCISIPHKEKLMQNESFTMDIENFSDIHRSFICCCCTKPKTKYIHDHANMGYATEDYMQVEQRMGTRHSTMQTPTLDGSGGTNTVSVNIDFNHNHFIANMKTGRDNGLEIAK